MLVLLDQLALLIDAGRLVPHNDVVVAKDGQDRVPSDTKLHSEGLRGLPVCVPADDCITSVCADASLDRVRAT